jgi:two-component system response regulator LytT
MMPLTIVIFEDDPYFYRLLRHMLQTIDPSYEVVGLLSSVEEGRAFFSYHQDIDLIIADIKLRDGLVFDALSYAPDDIPVIFITAHEEYAFQAFEYNSLCYLLKPVKEHQLAMAIRKSMRLRVPDHNDEFSLGNPVTGDNLSFWVRSATGAKRIPASMVRYISSEDKTTYLRLMDGSTYPLDKTLEEVASGLRSDAFMRVNRKYILPRNQVKGFDSLPNGRMRILLYGDDCPEIIVSRTQRKEVCKWLEK